MGRRLRHGDLPKTQRYKRVISLRHWWEWNYYHFFIDVLGKLNLMDRLGLEADTPVILGPYAGQLPFAAQFIKMGQLGQRHWIVPNNTPILADEILYCRTLENYKARVDHVLAFLELPLERDRSSERLFLNRGGPAMRQLVNLDEIWPVLKRYGFGMIDTATLTMKDQVEIFSKTRYLVALHGAGITNIIFRGGAPLNLLELHSSQFPPRRRVTNFERICRNYGYGYDRLAGEPQTPSRPLKSNFAISPALLEAKLNAWLV